MLWHDVSGFTQNDNTINEVVRLLGLQPWQIIREWGWRLNHLRSKVSHIAVISNDNQWIASVESEQFFITVVQQIYIGTYFSSYARSRISARVRITYLPIFGGIPRRFLEQIEI